MFIYELIVIALMLVFNAVFAAYEMALASVSRARLTILLSEKKKGAAEAAFMKDKMEASLATIQLGITLVGAIAAATGGVGIKETFVPYLNTLGISETLSEILAIVVLIIPLTFVTMVFGELVPKIIALNNRERIVLRLSPPMKILSRTIGPVVSLVEFTVRKVISLIRWGNRPQTTAHSQWLHELRASVSIARTLKLMGEREEKIVLSAAHLSTHLVRDIMIPAQDISMLCAQNTLMDAIVKAHLDMHTRFPVCRMENDPQTIDGYVNFKDIVVALKVNPKDPTVSGISRPIKKVRFDMPLSQLLEEMIRERNHIVIVTSQEGSVLGMVTLEDIIEELVGEIEDEFDRLPAHIHPCGDGWIMGGGLSMTTVASTAGFDWSSKYHGLKPPTLADWCVLKIGHPLAGGEIIEADGLRVVPRKFRRKKVSEALVSRLDS